ncbi:TRAP-type C4-dicarboxylate transport system, small permease component [Roseovarius litoreus]|uniref:TRAP transporter small permease protein n=2 Tax=Roseovarius litoreus TaxID=1155722 RepID=A0A1M7LL01_9RHOB|nr:TRAP-type C4-dicarboxylate transport system, small permease component [Roseovarius litoreus]
MATLPYGSWRTVLERGVLRPVAFLSQVGAVIAGMIMLGMIGHILYEIVLRGFFGRSTYVLDEFVGYGVAAMTFLALAHALNRNTHIRVAVLRDVVGPRFLQLLETLSILLALGAMSTTFHYIAKSVMRNLERGTTSATVARVPLWVPEGLVLLGIGMLLLGLIARLVETWLAKEG